MQQSLRDNAALIHRAFARALRSPTAGAMTTGETDERLRRFYVRAASFEQEARQLSGGNQQKVILSRWLARDPAVLVFAEPSTRRRRCRQGRDLQDHAQPCRSRPRDPHDLFYLPEIIGVSDRIVVMREGRIAQNCPAAWAKKRSWRSPSLTTTIPEFPSNEQQRECRPDADSGAADDMCPPARGVRAPMS